MEAETSHIDGLLRSFFQDEKAGRSYYVGARYYRVMAHLYMYLEAVDAEALLGSESATLLAAEREIHPAGAFARIFPAHTLILCLPGFIDGSWLMRDHTDARTQVSLTDRLLLRLRRQYPDEMPSYGCAIRDCTRAIKRARAVLLW